MSSPEEYEKALEDIEKLQKEVKSLTKRLGNITSRVQDLENLGLQQQIFDLSDRINSFSNESTKIKRSIYIQDLISIKTLAFDLLHRDGHLLPIPSELDAKHLACSNDIDLYYIQSKERIRHSDSISEMQTIQKGFLKITNEILKKYKVVQIEEH